MFIKSTIIPTTPYSRYRTLIKHSTTRQLERLFNALPIELQKIMDENVDTFTKYIDGWPKDIPYTHKLMIANHLLVPK